MGNIKETIIIAVGGSLLVPDVIDTKFIKQLKEMTLDLIAQGRQIILVPGGGKTARKYQKALAELNHAESSSLDWVGIKAIHLNCELLKHYFSDTELHVIQQPEEITGVHSALVIKEAYAPGNSSDMGAVRMAEITGATKIINFSNVSHVYTDDPRNNGKAEKLKRISWDDYQDLIPEEWTPGMSAPFDPVASQLAKNLGISVAVLGASIENLKGYLSGERFEGTVIS